MKVLRDLVSFRRPEVCASFLVPQVEALDLNPGVARIDRKTRKEFEEFKTKRKEGCASH